MTRTRELVSEGSDELYRSSPFRSAVWIPAESMSCTGPASGLSRRA
jgi:hypothetical protein